MRRPIRRRPGASRVAAGGRAFPAGPGAITAALRSPAPVFAVTSAFPGAAVAATDQLGRDPGSVRTSRADDLDPLGFGSGALLGRDHGNDGDALDLELGLGLEHVAGLGRTR
jgi:hypothetical protein